MSNIILKRIYYALDVVLASPMNTSSGVSQNTDSDLLQNGTGEYFIPGTSIAGALRSRLSADDKKTMAGFSEGENGKMSSLFISDLYFNKGGRKTVRDGVKLTEGKTVENKFDMEVLETGAKGTIFISYVLREQEQDKEELIKTLIADIQNGFIRFGANKNRGYGRMKISVIHRQTFCKTDKDVVKQLLAFDEKNTSGYKDHYEYEKWEADVLKSDDYVIIRVPLLLTGGISIRKYSARPNEADYEQITIGAENNETAVVPGTSWNGAIRANVFSTLKELGVTEQHAKEYVDQWFGYVDLKTKKAQQSLVVFGESQIEGAKALVMTRNMINRFDASTKDGALYTEKSYFKGDTTLEIMVKKADSKHYKALIGLLQIAIKDVQNGYVAIGGQTAVGRGVFAADDSKTIEYVNAEAAETYGKALFDFLEGGR